MARGSNPDKINPGGKLLEHIYRCTLTTPSALHIRSNLQIVPITISISVITAQCRHLAAAALPLRLQ